MQTLAQQLAEYLKMPHKDWHVAFVRGQAESARQMEDLDNRLQGYMASSSHQMMVAPVMPKRGALGKRVHLRTGRVVTEDEAEDKILRILVKELTEMGAPVLTKMESTANPEHAVNAAQVPGKLAAL